MKIVIAEKISSSAVELLKEPRWTLITPDQLEGKLAAELESADALIVRSAVQVDDALLQGAERIVAPVAPQFAVEIHATSR